MNQLGTASRREKVEEITINDRKLAIIRDSGADINIINEELAAELGMSGYEIELTKITNIFGSEYKVSREIILTYIWEDMQETDRFYIADTKDKRILIGRGALIKHEKNKKEWEKLKKEYSTVIASETTGKVDFMEAEINTEKDKKIRVEGRTIERSMMERIKPVIEDYEKKGLCSKSRSDWINPLRPVEKKDGRLRMATNMWFLNKIASDDSYSLPKIQHIIESLQGARYLTVLDLNEAFFQVPLKPEHRHKTAFKVGNRLYEWNVMPQGFKNSAAIFQRLMDTVLREIEETKVRVYLDDIIIFGKTDIEHDKNVREVLDTLGRSGMTINKKKIQFKQRIAKILGCYIDGVTQEPDNSKEQKILHYETPRDKSDVQKFLGFANVYKKYISNFAEIVGPLYDLIKKGTEFIWMEKEERAFKEILRQL